MLRGQTRIYQKDGGRWPDDTPCGAITQKGIPRPLLDAVDEVRQRSLALGCKRDDGKPEYLTKAEVVLDVLAIGLKKLSDKYDQLDRQRAARIVETDEVISGASQLPEIPNVEVDLSQIEM